MATHVFRTSDVRKPLMVCAFFVTPIMLSGASHYVRSDAAGTGSGADWANACPDFTGVCAPSSMVRGDTYYVADGVYAARRFNTPTSGSNVITIKKATILDHGTNIGWSNTLGDGSAVFTGSVYFVSDHWILDGQQRSSLTAGHGFKIDKQTAPDSSAGIFIGDPYLGKGGTAANNVTLQYFEVAGSGDRSDPKLFIDHGLQAALQNSQRDLTIRYFYVHDSGGVGLKLENLTNVVIEHGYITRNHSTPASHSEGIAARSIHAFTTRYCMFVDIEGTAHLTTPGGSDGVGSNWSIYGNVFARTPGNPYGIARVGNGAVYFLATQISGDVYVVNNTIVNMNNGLDGAGPGTIALNRTGNQLGRVYVVNNLWFKSDYVYSTCDSCEYFAWKSNSYYQTPGAVDPDPTKEVSPVDPFVNSSSGNYRLSVPTAAGTQLVSPFHLDPIGRLRGGDGAWDRGAYEYVVQSQTVGAPTGLAASSR